MVICYILGLGKRWWCLTSILRGVSGKGGNSYGGIGMGKSGVVLELGERSCF